MFLPQMSPMWWTFLSMMFTISMLMMMQILYFNFKKKMTEKKTKKMNYMNWMW